MTAITSSGASEADRARKRTCGCVALTALTTACPPPPGQVHVQQHDIGQVLGDQRDRGLDVVRLTHELDLVTELGPDPGPEQAVVIDEEDPRLVPGHGAGGWRGHARLGWRSPAARGMVSDTSVPSPCALRTVADPPRRAIRA